ncbi:exopolyphosphatase-like protein [Xylaria palmicola]|nr:exopolyphosphatase-like protein [Xylaria palmicola]
MPPRTSLKTFLATAHAALRAPPSKRPTPLTFVVGNESADLDSLCSALLLAYFHTYAPPAKRALVGDGSCSGASTLHIPVCHLQRADLALRPEFAAVLRDADLGGDDVVTLEDILPRNSDGGRSLAAATAATGQGGTEPGEAVRPEETRWLLVDHNAMTGSLARAFGSRVVGCVDHHADEDAVPRDAAVRVVEKSGSCTSLVLERCTDIWAALGPTVPPGDSGDAARIDAQLARLALAPILVDTSNLGDRNKTTPHDERAVALAESKIAADTTTTTTTTAAAAAAAGGDRYDRDAFFARISALKEDIAGMSLRDVLRKDYKEWSTGGLRLGTSSVPRGFGRLVEEKARGDAGALAAALGDWAAERDGDGGGGRMDLVVVLTAFRDDVDDDAGGRFARELLVWARGEAGVRAVERFEAACARRLRLETWRGGALDCDRAPGEDGRAEWRRCWTQGAVEHSRKQIAPMLRDALKEVSGGK